MCYGMDVRKPALRLTGAEEGTPPPVLIQVDGEPVTEDRLDLRLCLAVTIVGEPWAAA